MLGRTRRVYFDLLPHHRCPGGSLPCWPLATYALACGVVCSVKSERMEELRQLIVAMLGRNVVSIEELRTFTGTCQSFASLLVTWRLFISTLWVALYSKEPSSAPPNCIWTKRIFGSLCNGYLQFWINKMVPWSEILIVSSV